jgi:hypothetical protein
MRSSARATPANMPNRFEDCVDYVRINHITKAQPYAAAHGDHHVVPGTGPAAWPTTDFYADKSRFEHADPSGASVITLWLQRKPAKQGRYIEAWLYQNIAKAKELCQVHGYHDDKEKFSQWERDRASVDEVVQIKDQTKLRDRHNIDLSERLPTELMLQCGKSFAHCVSEFSHCAILKTALKMTYSSPTPPSPPSPSQLP